MTREQELETCLRECWGVTLLLALMYPDDRKAQEAVAKVDTLCREAGLMDEPARF